MAEPAGLMLRWLMATAASAILVAMVYLPVVLALVILVSGLLSIGYHAPPQHVNYHGDVPMP